MPYTTYGLLKTIRSHTVSSPVGRGEPRDRPAERLQPLSPRQDARVDRRSARTAGGQGGQGRQGRGRVRSACGHPEPRTASPGEGRRQFGGQVGRVAIGPGSRERCRSGSVRCGGVGAQGRCRAARHRRAGDGMEACAAGFGHGVDDADPGAAARRSLRCRAFHRRAIAAIHAGVPVVPVRLRGAAEGALRGAAVGHARLGWCGTRHFGAARPAGRHCCSARTAHCACRRC